MKNLKKLCEYFAVAFPIVLVCGFIGLVIKEVQSREKQLNVISHQTIKGMRNLLEKYYNINFYCSYKLQFFIFRRMLNLFYWLSFSKWKNGYINRCISTNKRHEAAGMDKGVDVYISSMASNTPYIISIWAFCLVCLACIKIFRISLLSILGNGVYFLLLIPIGICGYYVNEIFLFKGDKYRKYFAEFAKKKRYLLYYGIYVVSLIIRLATFYLLLASA